MALETIEKAAELNATIDKVLKNKEKVANGIQINGNRYYYTKSSGKTVDFAEGTAIKMVYDHAKDTENGNDVYFIKHLDKAGNGFSVDDHPTYRDNKSTGYSPTETVSKSPDTQVLIVRQNCVTNAVAFHQATKSKSEDDILATAKQFEEWIFRTTDVEEEKDDVPF
tara:strand:- start:1791 stop:2291 length:501 start_codon:yes stop_codon:yes gene_type:complete